MGGRFRVANEDGTGAKLTCLRTLADGKQSLLKSRGVQIGMQMLKINDVKDVHKMKFKQILKLLRSLGNDVRVVDFGFACQEQETLSREEEEKNEVVLTPPISHVHQNIKVSSNIEASSPTAPVQEEVKGKDKENEKAHDKEETDNVEKEEEKPKLTIQVKNLKSSSSPPAESDDLDEFESFLDSTCRSAASLESEVGNEIMQHDLLRASEIGAQIDEIMEDL